MKLKLKVLHILKLNNNNSFERMKKHINNNGNVQITHEHNIGF